MEKLVNFKVKRISDERYLCFCDNNRQFVAEGATEWEALTAARKALKKVLYSKD